MPSLASDGLPAALTEADPADPLAPAPADQPPQTAADLRAAALAARTALAQVLKDRAALINTTDADLAKLVEDALGRVLAVLATQPSDYTLWVLPRLVDALARIGDELTRQASQATTQAIGRAWTLGVRAVDAPIAAAAPPLPATTAAPAALGEPSTQQLRALQVMTTAQIGGASQAAVATINRELGQVVLGVQSPFQAQQKVAAVLTDRTSSQLRGILGLSLGQAFNSSSFQRLQVQVARDPKIKKMWRRSGKRHARWNHDAIDGTVEEVNTPFTLQPGNKKGGPVAIMFPADPAAPIGETINCGCVLIPWKATWGMQYKGAKPYTAQERADRGLGGAPAAKKAAPATKPQGTQAKALAAFGASPTKAGTLKDVTGQTMVVDTRLVADKPAPAALLKGTGNKAVDLAAYWTVQALRRPTEVWQAERVEMSTGEVMRTRELVKRFAAAGQQWQATATLKPEGGRWVGVQPVTINPAPPAGPVARNGVRVWPRRG